MSIVIIGGNERMVTRYENLCESYGCKAKVFVKENSSIKKKWDVRIYCCSLQIQCPIKW